MMNENTQMVIEKKKVQKYIESIDFINKIEIKKHVA
jgi:hypothetical protein